MEEKQNGCPFSNKIYFSIQKNKWIVDDLNIAKNILNSNSVRTPHLSEFDEETASFFLALTLSNDESLPRLKKVFSRFFTYKNIIYLSDLYFIPRASNILDMLEDGEIHDVKETYISPYIKQAIFSLLGISDRKGFELMAGVNFTRKQDVSEEYSKAAYHIVFEQIRNFIISEPVISDGFVFFLRNSETLTLEEKVTFVYPFIEMLCAEMTMELPVVFLKNLLEMKEGINKVNLDNSLFEKVFEESARLLNNICLTRVAIQDIEINNHETIKKGDKINILVSEANRDESYFKKASKFIWNRENMYQSLSFGHGSHFCLGKDTIKAMSLIAAEQILLRNIEYFADSNSFRTIT